VSSAAQQQEVYTYLTSYGLPTSFYQTIHLCWCYSSCLFKSSFYQKIKTKIDKEIKVGRELNDGEKNELKPLVDNIALSLPEIKSYEFRIYEVENIPCYKEPNMKRINISKK
jgi:hypothetical protein